MSRRLHARRILACGDDEVLLWTRKLLLEEAGFAVDTVLGVKGFRTGHGNIKGRYGLFILCHTLPLDDRITVTEFAVEQKVPLYQMFDSAAPQEFLGTASKLLGSD